MGGTGSLGNNLSFDGDSLYHVVNLGDSLTIGGTISFANTGAGFGIDNLTGINWGTILDGTYTLIDGTLDSANLDNLGLANAYGIGGGRSAYFQSGSLQLVVVPEPSTAALLGGLGALALLRRRRA